MRPWSGGNCAWLAFGFFETPSHPARDFQLFICQLRLPQLTSPSLQVLFVADVVFCFWQKSRESWQKVFFIAAAVYATGAILFCILAKGEVQAWAKDATPDIELVVEEEDEESKKMNGVNGSSKHTPIYTQKPLMNGDAAAAKPMLASNGV